MLVGDGFLLFVILGEGGMQLRVKSCGIDFQKGDTSFVFLRCTYFRLRGLFRVDRRENLLVGARTKQG